MITDEQEERINQLLNIKDSEFTILHILSNVLNDEELSEEIRHINYSITDTPEEEKKSKLQYYLNEVYYKTYFIEAGECMEIRRILTKICPHTDVYRHSSARIIDGGVNSLSYIFIDTVCKYCGALLKSEIKND